ncbi:uncharacterized protein LOC130674905 [Microplitis mediator]|uniref:uncharacterized protein LOC130674905 n=1 Tax=Microplitis mediator TaxID=375433 RepID=UPI002556C738|nr:uncharacterized protein LOC130674905 [Microplitis mediator]
MASSENFETNLKIVFQTFGDGFTNPDSIIKKIDDTTIERGRMRLTVTKITTSPKETFEFLKSEVKDESIEESAPFILLFGRSGSRKSSTVFGRDGCDFPGLARSWFPAGTNIEIRMMEFKDGVFFDLVKMWNDGDRMGSKDRITNPCWTSLNNIKHLLSFQSLAATANNKQSSRGFIWLEFVAFDKL